MGKPGQIVCRTKIARFLPFLLLSGCAGVSRSCSSLWAESVGADWVVAQYTNNGVLHCWKLHNTAIANEHSSDGIYWKSPAGHLVHCALARNSI